MGSILARIMADEERLTQQVWEKGHIIPGREHEAHLWRRDDLGWTIYRPDHGKRESPYGWERDHYPIAKANGGPDTIENLRPLHWRVNASLGALVSGR